MVASTVKWIAVVYRTADGWGYDGWGGETPEEAVHEALLRGGMEYGASLDKMCDCIIKIEANS